MAGLIKELNMKCKNGYTLEVCRSAAGFYLGTKDEMGCPNCRLSDYAPTAEEAEHLLLLRQFGCIENEACHGGKGCFVDG